MRSTLIICSRNRPALLSETIESVLRGSRLPTELIIVDQSDQPNAAVARLKTWRTCKIRYARMRSVGVSRARNYGAAKAAYPILAFIDDDMLVAPDWFQQLIEAIVQAGPESAVTGRVLPGTPEAPGAFVSALVEGQQPRTFAGRIGTDVLASCNFGMYRSTFKVIGGFDERLGPGTTYQGGGEDNDLGFRLLEAGHRIVHAPTAVIYHRAWRHSRTYFAVRWAYGRGQGGFYAKHLSVRDRYMLKRLCTDVGLRVLRFPWRLVHRPRLALADLVFTAGVLSGCGQWLLRQSITQRGPRYEPAAVT